MYGGARERVCFCCSSGRNNCASRINCAFDHAQVRPDHARREGCTWRLILMVLFARGRRAWSGLTCAWSSRVVHRGKTRGVPGALLFLPLGNRGRSCAHRRSDHPRPAMGCQTEEFFEELKVKVHPRVISQDDGVGEEPIMSRLRASTLANQRRDETNTRCHGVSVLPCEAS